MAYSFGLLLMRCGRTLLVNEIRLEPARLSHLGLDKH